MPSVKLNESDYNFGIIKTVVKSRQRPWTDQECSENSDTRPEPARLHGIIIIIIISESFPNDDWLERWIELFRM